MNVSEGEGEGEGGGEGGGFVCLSLKMDVQG